MLGAWERNYKEVDEHLLGTCEINVFSICTDYKNKKGTYHVKLYLFVLWALVATTSEKFRYSEHL